MVEMDALERLQIGDIVDTLPATARLKLITQANAWQQSRHDFCKLVLGLRRSKPNKSSCWNQRSQELFSKSSPPRANIIVMDERVSQHSDNNPEERPEASR